MTVSVAIRGESGSYNPFADDSQRDASVAIRGESGSYNVGSRRQPATYSVAIRGESGSYNPMIIAFLNGISGIRPVTPY